VSWRHARASQLAVALWIVAGPFAACAQPAGQDARELFARGQQALEHGDLVQAEAAFRRVLTIHTNDAGAHANLGVIAMRRRQWTAALGELESAKRLAPGIVGIRVNIGLVYFRQNDFHKAIPSFESVVHDDPTSAQARYLLGLCYYFDERYGDAVSALNPLWPTESGKLEYLYVVATAAARSGNEELQRQALRHMVEVGNDSAELHFFIGKAYLQHADVERAIGELEIAAKNDPQLPFVHYFLGVAYRKRRDAERARAEFQQDMKIEPDVPFNYDQMGAVSAELQEYDDAARFYKEALRRDDHLVSSHLGLAKIYKERGQYPEALGELDAASRLDPASPTVHYLRGQILVRVGRATEGRAELENAERMKRLATAKFEREVSGESFLDPQLASEPRQ
jgi:tetratricopeptide (TPR) repeat protein